MICEVWWARPDAARPWHRELFTADELGRADAYRRPEDRDRFTVGCATSRLVLGRLLGLADLPLLISIKMKFLFVAASIYGFDVRRREERLFILHVFQLAFSSDRCRADTLHIVEHWHEKKHGIHDIDWRVIQQEYRDYIDLVKMLQLLPGIGAAVGAYANYNLLDHLGETAKNAYRMRLLALEQ